jgi:hypothetical protein
MNRHSFAAARQLMHAVPDAACTIVEGSPGYLPTVFAGDSFDSLRDRVNLVGVSSVQHRCVHCSAAIFDRLQGLPADGVVQCFVACNSLPFDDVASILQASGAGPINLREAVGIWHGQADTSVAVWVRRGDVVPLHRYLLENLPGFGCFAVVADDDATNGFDAAGYVSPKL